MSVSDKRFQAKHKEVLRLRRQVRRLQQPVQLLARLKMNEYVGQLAERLEAVGIKVPDGTL